MGRRKTKEVSTKPEAEPMLTYDQTVTWSAIGLVVAFALLIALYMTARTDRALRRNIKKHAQGAVD